MGQKDQAQKILGRLNEEAKSHYVAPYALALVQTALGDKDRAIEELEHAYQEHETNYFCHQSRSTVRRAARRSTLRRIGAEGYWRNEMKIRRGRIASPLTSDF